MPKWVNMGVGARSIYPKLPRPKKKKKIKNAKIEGPLQSVQSLNTIPVPYCSALHLTGVVLYEPREGGKWQERETHRRLFASAHFTLTSHLTHSFRVSSSRR